MAIISDTERQLTIDTLQENITYFEWFASKYDLRSQKMKLHKLIERNKNQIKNLKK